MARLRLAIVTPRFWPLVGERSTHLLRLAESLIAAGHSLTVVTPLWKRSWPAKMSIGPVPIVRLAGSPRGAFSALRWMISLSSWLRDSATQLDAMLVAGLKQEAYVALGSFHGKRLFTVVLAGEGDVAWQRTAPLGHRVAERCRQTRAIVAASEALADELRRGGYEPDHITVIPRRVPITPPSTPRLRVDARVALTTANYDLATTANAQVTVAIGRLTPDERMGDLVRAWRIVTARRPEARLWIIGDGPERERLYRQIGDLDQRFRAFLPGTFDCLDEVLAASDVYVLPGQHSLVPIALLEAQAAGVPAIAADSASVRQHVAHGQTGLLYPLGDFKALAAAILNLMENPEMAAAYGAAARAAITAGPAPADEAADYLALIERLRAST
jgi:glycosyltransferase involved in cell wall biosynthesis